MGGEWPGVGIGTPLKFNMEPEKKSLEKRRFRTWKPSFSGSMLNLGGVGGGW